MSFTELIWEWDYHQEKEQLGCLFAAGEALQFLSSESVEQQNSICGCPFCEVWNEHRRAIIDLNHLLHCFLSSELSSTLSSVEKAFESLSEEECACFNFKIFDLEGWSEIRKLSCETIVQLEWPLLLALKPELENI